MTADDPFEYLFSLAQFGIKFGLDNIRALLAARQHPERAFRSVHVAGTNGKGSVSAMVERALRAAGCRTGRYTSPHLVDLTERFAIDGRNVDPALLRRVIADLRQTIDTLRSQKTLAASPTFFEVTTAAAFELFERAAVEIAVCEVGLGGRLDATNVLTPDVTAITSIALDHEQYLGSTLASIAREKGGIIKRAVPVVVGAMDHTAEREIATIATAQGASVIRAVERAEWSVLERDLERGTTIRLRTPVADYGNVTVALPGDHQVVNALVAVAILEALGAGGWPVTPASIAAGLSQVRWPGRLQTLRGRQGETLLLDAAHNPEGAATLAAFLGRRGERHPLVFAAMQDKDSAAILRVLTPVISHLIATRASHPRSTDPHALAAIAKQLSPRLPVTIAETLDDAMTEARLIDANITIAGSIFLLGDLMKQINARDSLD